MRPIRFALGSSASDGSSRQGRFLFFCGVTGHGAGGMWDYLVVSRDIELPSVHVRSTRPAERKEREN